MSSSYPDLPKKVRALEREVCRLRGQVGAIQIALLAVAALTTLILLSGCSKYSEYFTSQGTGVDCYSATCPDPAELDAAIEYYAERFPYHDTRRLLRLVYLVFVDKLDYAGLFYDNGQITLPWSENSTIAESALFHELTHGVIFLEYGSMDRRHDRFGDIWAEEKRLTEGYKPLDM